MVKENRNNPQSKFILAFLKTYFTNNEELRMVLGKYGAKYYVEHEISR